ncbi:MAG TPA: XdhC/CoxI family protein [Pyrinomonadaceae bacterium]|jgi:xanthine dehydrogenase accessory factor|nr:XdhC/CoxI family protein [Pyrinomonadaceae bacterium]
MTGGAGGSNLSAHITRRIAGLLREGSTAALATIVEAQKNVGAKLLVEQTGARTSTTGDAELDDALAEYARAFLDSRAEARTLRVEEFAPALALWRDARVMFERVEPEPRVVVCGAGHVGAALARLAARVGYRVTLLDDRVDFVARSRFPEEDIELVAAPGWAAGLTEAIGTGRGVYVAVVTRGHNEDEECMRAVLAARPDYVGMIGSRRRTNIVLARLRESGFDEESLKQVRAPVGLDIGAVSPEEVALSILAEIVAERRGGTCAPLSAWRRE